MLTFVVKNSLQNHAGAGQPYPTSSPSSPARSRSGSFRLQIPPAHMSPSPQSSPASAFFPGGLPSPFRYPQPSTPSSATMDPSHSVRSSSPSSTSSVSGVTMSRAGSVSAASSVYGTEAGTIVSQPVSSSSSTSATPGAAPRQTAAAPPSTGRAKHQTHSRRPSSPTKGGRSGRKLTDQDRKDICLYYEAHPQTKQDDIGAQFGVERSTVSKILKMKSKWLAIESEEQGLDQELAASLRNASFSSRASSTFGGSATPDLSATPHQSPPAPAMSKSNSSIFSMYQQQPSSRSAAPHADEEPAEQIVGGRYPRIDNELANWARQTLAQPGSRRLSDEALQSKAREIAANVEGAETFKASQTWLDGFKQRAGISAGLFKKRGASREEVDEDDADELEEQLDDDPDFQERATRHTASGRTKRQSALYRHRPTLSSATSASSVNMEVDSRTPLRPSTANSSTSASGAGDRSIDSEATPTHSTVHSRATSAAAEQRMFDSMYGYSPTEMDRSRSRTVMSRNSSMSASTSEQYPFAQQDARIPTSYSTNDLSSYNNPLQSPFQDPSNSSFYAPMGSGANSPIGRSYQHHDRSGSTASTTSSYSGLTAFSTNGGNGTPLTGSIYGSFPHSNSNSVPSTPAGATTGYFNHGPDGTQSQLQAAFVAQQRGEHHSGGASVARRATISGGSPFNPAQAGNGGGGGNTVGGVPLTSSLSMGPMSTRSSHRLATVANAASHSSSIQGLEQASASLKSAIDYLKSSAGFATPQDLIALFEVHQKMIAALPPSSSASSSGAAANDISSRSHSASSNSNSNNNSSSSSHHSHSHFSQQQQPSQQQHQAPPPQAQKFSFPPKQHRLKLGRTQSASSIHSLGMTPGGSFNGSSSLLRSPSVVSLGGFDRVMEEQR